MANAIQRVAAGAPWANDVNRIVAGVLGQSGADLSPTGNVTAGGDLTASGQLKWKSGTNFTMTLDHAATADRTITFPDATDTVVLLTATQTVTNKIVSLQDGAAGTPSLRFDSDTNTGLYWVSADRIGVTAGGTKVLEVVNNGGTFGLGIGMSPSVPLDVQRSSTDWVARIDQAGSSAGAKVLQILTSATGATDSALSVESGGGGTYLFVAQASGLVCIGDTSNAQMTQGLTINQGAADDAIITLKSSDVVQPFTALLEADTYGHFAKFSPTAGGLQIIGICETGTTTGLRLSGWSGADNTARSTAALGVVQVDAFLTDGSTSVTSVGANGNLFVVRNSSNARFLVDAEGDVHADATVNQNAWDDEEDVALLEAYRLLTMQGQPKDFRRLFADDIDRHAEILARTGVITLNKDGRHFYSLKGTLGLLMDSMRQIYGRLRETQRELADLRQQMLEAG